MDHYLFAVIIRMPESGFKSKLRHGIRRARNQLSFSNTPCRYTVNSKRIPTLLNTRKKCIISNKSLSAPCRYTVNSKRIPTLLNTRKNCKKGDRKIIARLQKEIENANEIIENNSKILTNSEKMNNAETIKILKQIIKDNAKTIKELTDNILHNENNENNENKNPCIIYHKIDNPGQYKRGYKPVWRKTEKCREEAPCVERNHNGNTWNTTRNRCREEKEKENKEKENKEKEEENKKKYIRLHGKCYELIEDPDNNSNPYIGRPQIRKYRTNTDRCRKEKEEYNREQKDEKIKSAIAEYKSDCNKWNEHDYIIGEAIRSYWYTKFKSCRDKKETYIKRVLAKDKSILNRHPEINKDYTGRIYNDLPYEK